MGHSPRPESMGFSGLVSFQLRLAIVVLAVAVWLVIECVLLLALRVARAVARRVF